MKKLFLALLTTASMLNARADITTGLMASWRLDNGPGSSNIVDSAGNGNTGTLNNFTDPTYVDMWTLSSQPQSGGAYALLFNTGATGTGTNAFVNVPDAPSLDKQIAANQWTVAAWVNCSVTPGSEPANAGIVAKGLLGQEAYDLYMSGGHFYSIVRNAAETSNQMVYSTNVTVAANTWYHVAVTYSSAGITNIQMSMYINGVLNYSAPSNSFTTLYSNNAPVMIGGRENATPGVNAYPFQGTIDDVFVYSRALSASDIAQLYTNAPTVPADSGIGYWNGLVGSGGNATLDTTSRNFSTNLWTAPLGTADTLADLLNVEKNNSVAPVCFFSDAYYNSGKPIPVSSTNLTVATGGVALGTATAAGTVTFLNSAVTYFLNSSDNKGIKDGTNPTSLVESGFGTVILTGTNTFSGGTTINFGTLQVGDGGASGSPLGSGPVTNNSVLVFYGNDSPSVNNVISGTGLLTQEGSGTLTLGGANTYSGGTTLSGGTMKVSSIGDSGTSTLGTGVVNLNGGKLMYSGSGDTTARQFNGTVGTTNTVDVPNGVTLELSGRVTGTCSVGHQ